MNRNSSHLKSNSGFTTSAKLGASSSFSSSPAPKAFTIVELLVVIAVIGILAAITLVSYTGVSQRAASASLQSDLTSAKKTLLLYQVIYNSYPTALNASNCPTAPTADTKFCLKASSNNTFSTYVSNGTSFFTINATNTNGTIYTTTETLSPEVATLSPTDWLTIGTQTWAKANLNVGTMVTGVTAQTNNSILEKYCYSDLESNCTTYGAFYQWDEAMQYITTPGAQGICPANSHIPTDNDWKILEIQLGMTQAQADATSYRGTNQGTQLKSGGLSGLNIPLAGYRTTAGSFDVLSSGVFLWSSSESSTSAWARYLQSGPTAVYRNTYTKAFGFSVRCLGN